MKFKLTQAVICSQRRTKIHRYILQRISNADYSILPNTAKKIIKDILSHYTKHKKDCTKHWLLYSAKRNKHWLHHSAKHIKHCHILRNIANINPNCKHPPIDVFYKTQQTLTITFYQTQYILTVIFYQTQQKLTFTLKKKTTHSVTFCRTWKTLTLTFFQTQERSKCLIIRYWIFHSTKHARHWLYIPSSAANTIIFY